MHPDLRRIYANLQILLSKLHWGPHEDWRCNQSHLRQVWQQELFTLQQTSKNTWAMAKISLYQSIFSWLDVFWIPLLNDSNPQYVKSSIIPQRSSSNSRGLFHTAHVENPWFPMEKTIAFSHGNHAMNDSHTQRLSHGNHAMNDSHTQRLTHTHVKTGSSLKGKRPQESHLTASVHHLTK